MAWDEILGQELATRVFQVHLAAGRVAPAYLLVGPEGIGKRRLALELAKALNCSACLPRGDAGLANASRPCDACPTCRQISRTVHPDVHLIVPEGPSDQIKIDSIRHLLSRVSLRPYSATVQVAIIDGAERLTEEAANSLLKMLEEPSTRTRFLLVTSQLPACLPTIVSRCQVVRCQPLRPDQVKQILIRGASCEPQAAETIARLAGGSASHAIALAGRWSAYQAAVTRLASDGPSMWLEQPLPETREEVIQLLEGMLGWLRDVAMATAGRTDQVAHVEYAEVLRRQARAVEADRCVETALQFFALRESLEQFVSPRLVASLAREHWLSLMAATRDG